MKWIQNLFKRFKSNKENIITLGDRDGIYHSSKTSILWASSPSQCTVVFDPSDSMKDGRA